MRSTVAGHGKLTSSKLILLQRSCQRTQCQPSYGHSASEANWKGEKISVSGCLMSWLKIKNIVILKWLLLFYATTKNHFLIGLWCTTKSALYTTTDDDPLNDWTEKKLQSTSQSQICTKKRSWSLFGGLLPIWSTKAFWIPVKPLHLRSMLSKSMSHTENYNACSQYWSTQGTQCFCITTLTTHCTTSTSKVEWIGLRIFTIFTWPPANRLLLLQTFRQLFARKRLPQPAGGRKCFPKVRWIVKHRFLCCRNKQTYFSLAKHVLIVMVPI